MMLRRIVPKTGLCLLAASLAFHGSPISSGPISGPAVNWSPVSWSPAPAAAQDEPDEDLLSNGEMSDEDANLSFEELVSQAQRLLITGRPIDARAKLQRALRLAPKDYRPHMMLGQYYLLEVSHFKLAYRYLRNAAKLFEDQYGSDLKGNLAPDQQIPQLTLLYLLSEAELNLDKYKDSLNTLDRIEKHPFSVENGIPDWYPGTRAWVLMKLKRTDEAIAVAQAGLLQRADPRRTWNILGILLSVKENREQSLFAFGQAIRAELSIGGQGQVATPLNNAGEVYREIFQDDLAEASWAKAVRLPDGCDHILPSLNLAILYVDELRLFQAERSLSDFEACFAQQQVRKDTEHRTLLALERGKIAVHSNEVDRAIELLTIAEQEQQWFGKIGTNENDVEFASAIAMAQALAAKAEELKDTVRETVWEDAKDLAKIPWLQLRSWWQNRKARQISLEELDDLEDLFIRNTDTMLEYPTLGTVLAGFRSASLARRLERMKKEDNRPDAHTYYDLYLGSNYLAHGNAGKAVPLLGQALQNLREIDRLARAETIAKLIQAKREAAEWWRGKSIEDETAELKSIQELFDLLPAHLRQNGIALPVKLTVEAADATGQKLLETIAGDLFGHRFVRTPLELKEQTRFALVLSDQPSKDSAKRMITIHLVDASKNSQITAHSAEVSTNGEGTASLVNEFIKQAFQHRSDPPPQPLKPIPILEGIVKQ